MASTLEEVDPALNGNGNGLLASPTINNGAAATLTQPSAPAPTTSPAATGGGEEEQCAVVLDPETEELFEMPVDAADNALPVAVVVAAFPQAHGLKFKNPATGANRTLLWVAFTCWKEWF